MEAAMNEIYNPIASTYHWSNGECGADEHVMFGGLYPKRPTSPIMDWSSDFHTFAVDWTESGLVYYLDDNVVYNISASDCVMPPGPM
jgi:beta-glucanase (GH16 family)